MKKRIVVLDPGHGGEATGAIGPNGLEEKEVNLLVAKKLKELLIKEGFEVHLTRDDDYDISLDERVEISKKLNADLFLSIHHNASDEIYPLNRTEIYVPFDEMSPAYDLAYILYQKFKERFGIPVLPPLPARYRVLKGNVPLSILGEASYITHPDEEKRLKYGARIEEEAEIYFEAIKEYFRRGTVEIKDFIVKGKTIVARMEGEPDYTTAILKVDEAIIDYEVIPETKVIQAYLKENLKGGIHRIEFQIWSKGGNRSPRLIKTIHIRKRVGAFSVIPFPEMGVNPVLLKITLFDPEGHPFPQNESVELSIRGGEFLYREDRTDDSGSVYAIVRLFEEGGELSVLSGDFEGMARLEVIPRKTRKYTVFLLKDKKNGRPIIDGEITSGRAKTISRRGGFVFIEEPGEEINIRARGYKKGTYKLSHKTHELELEPLFGGVLLEKKILIDPRGGGGDFLDLKDGRPLSLLNLQLAFYLKKLLERGGANVYLTRETDATRIDDIERVKMSIELKPALMLILNLNNEVNELRYYYRDFESKSFAERTKRVLKNIYDEIEVKPGSTYILIHPPPKRIDIRLMPSKPLETIAYLLFCSVLRELGYDEGVTFRINLRDQKGLPHKHAFVEDEDTIFTKSDEHGELVLLHLPKGESKLTFQINDHRVEKTIKIIRGNTEIVL